MAGVGREVVLTRAGAGPAAPDPTSQVPARPAAVPTADPVSGPAVPSRRPGTVRGRPDPTPPGTRRLGARRPSPGPPARPPGHGVLHRPAPATARRPPLGLRLRLRRLRLPPGYPPYGYVPATKTNGLAVASLVCSLLLGVRTGIGAGRRLRVHRPIPDQASRTTGNEGSGLALAGIIVGFVGTARHGPDHRAWPSSSDHHCHQTGTARSTPLNTRSRAPDRAGRAGAGRLRPPRCRPSRWTWWSAPRGRRRWGAASSPPRPGRRTVSSPDAGRRVHASGGGGTAARLVDVGGLLCAGDGARQRRPRPIRCSTGSRRAGPRRRRPVGTGVRNSMRPAAWRSRRVRSPTIWSPPIMSRTDLTVWPLLPMVVRTRHWSLRIWTSWPGGSGHRVTTASRGTAFRISLHSSTWGRTSVEDGRRPAPAAVRSEDAGPEVK